MAPLTGIFTSIYYHFYIDANNVDRAIYNEISKVLTKGKRLIITKASPIWDLVGDNYANDKYLMMMKVNRGIERVGQDSSWAEKYDLKFLQVSKDGEQVKIKEVKDGSIVNFSDYAIQIAYLKPCNKFTDVKSLNLSLDQLRTGQFETSLEWCDQRGIGNEMRAAIVKEVDSVRKVNRCLELIPESSIESSKTMTSKLVLAIKMDIVTGQVKRCKARWCARGFQDPRSEDSEWRVDSETTTELALKTLIAFAASKKLDLRSVDYETAFLQGHEYRTEELKEPLYMKLPTVLKGSFGYGRDHIAKLKKSLYGLKDAPKRWKQRLVEVLKSVGFRECESDPCLLTLEKEPRNTVKKPEEKDHDKIVEEINYIFKEPENIIAMCCLHVDDTLFAADEEFYTAPEYWGIMSKEIKIGTLDHINDGGITYCGKRITKTETGYVTSQKHYVEKLKKIEIPADKNPTEPYNELSEKGKCNYRSIVGCLIWVAVTRADLGYMTSLVASKVGKQTWGDIPALNEVIQEAKDHDVDLRFPFGLKMHNVYGFCDASFQNRPDKCSQQGVLVVVGEKLGRKFIKGVPLFWKSSKQIRAHQSTQGAELISLRSLNAAAKYVAGFLIECGLSKNKDIITLLTDANDTAKLTVTSKTPREKNLQGDLAGIRRDAINEVVQVQHLPGKINPVDPLTKQLSECKEQMRILRDSLRAGIFKISEDDTENEIK